MTCVIRPAIIFCLLFFNFPFFAQNDTVSGPERRLQELVVQATRTASNTPVPHTNFKAEQIARALHAQDVPMLLAATPSLVENSDAGTGIGYTGLRIRGSDPTRVNVTINGVPLNDSESQGVFWVDVPDIAGSAAEIQVQRGVGSSTNGAGSFGATVNVDLSKVEAEPGAYLGSTLGAFGTYKFTAAANTGLLNRGWAFDGRYSRIHSDGYIDRATADLQSGRFSATHINDRHSLQLLWLSGQEKTYQAWYGVPAQYLGDPQLGAYNPAGTERPGSPYDNEVDDYRQQHVLLHYKQRLGALLDVQINLHYTRGKGFYEQYKADESFEAYGLAPWAVADTLLEETDLIRRRRLDNDFYGTTFVLRRRSSGARHALYLLGGGWNTYHGRHFGEIIWSELPTGAPKDFRYYDNTADKRDGNLFFKTELGLGNGWTAFADLQIRTVDYRFWGFNSDLTPANQRVSHLFFNPKLGFTKTVNLEWTAYGFWGIGQREPNRDDYTQSSPVTRPRAEFLSDVEMGIRGKWARANWAANFFWMQYRNQLVLDGRINDVGAYIRTNVPDSYRAGLEVEGVWKMNDRWTLSANSSWSRNKVKKFVEYIDNWDSGAQEIETHSQTDLAFSPSVIAFMEASWLIWRRPARSEGETDRFRCSLNLSGKHVGRQYLDNSSRPEAQLPAYTYSDWRVNLNWGHWLGRETGLVVSVNNWLNTRYVSNGWIYRFRSAGYDPRPDDPFAVQERDGQYHQAGFFPQAGRHWMASFYVKF